MLVLALTALLKVFWERYHKLAPWQRVYYEMIQVDALIKPFTDYDADPTEMNRQVRVGDSLEVRTHYNILHRACGACLCVCVFIFVLFLCLFFCLFVCDRSSRSACTR